MDTNDINIMIKLLDQAITSNNTTVKELLQSLLVTVSLIHADDKKKFGPISEMVNSVQMLRQNLIDMQHTIESMTRRIEHLEATLNKKDMLKIPSSKRVDPYTRPNPFKVPNSYDDISFASFEDYIKEYVLKKQYKK